MQTLNGLEIYVKSGLQQIFRSTEYIKTNECKITQDIPLTFE